MIRRACPRDALGLISCINRVGAEGVYLNTEKLTLTRQEEAEFLRKANRGGRLYLVAVVNGEVVASADVVRGHWTKDRHTAKVGIALRDDVRGVGLGLSMMRSMIAWARSAGVRKLTLGVFATNRPAIALYRKLGFRPEGRLRGQVKLRGKLVDEIRMARWL